MWGLWQLRGWLHAPQILTLVTMLRDQCWRTLALQPIISHLFRLRCSFRFIRFIIVWKKKACKGIRNLSESLITWPHDCYFWSTSLSYSISTRRVSKICPASFCREVNLGLLNHCWMDFLILERWPAFFFISGLWVGPGLCLHQLSSLFSETHCLLVESNFNWNGWKYKSFSVHQNGTAKLSSSH